MQERSQKKKQNERKAKKIGRGRWMCCPFFLLHSNLFKTTHEMLKSVVRALVKK